MTSTQTFTPDQFSPAPYESNMDLLNTSLPNTQELDDILNNIPTQQSQDMTITPQQSQDTDMTTTLQLPQTNTVSQISVFPSQPQTVSQPLQLPQISTFPSHQQPQQTNVTRQTPTVSPATTTVYETQHTGIGSMTNLTSHPATNPPINTISPLNASHIQNITRALTLKPQPQQPTSMLRQLLSTSSNGSTNMIPSITTLPSGSTLTAPPPPMSTHNHHQQQNTATSVTVQHIPSTPTTSSRPAPRKHISMKTMKRKPAQSLQHRRRTVFGRERTFNAQRLLYTPRTTSDISFEEPQFSPISD